MGPTKQPTTLQEAILYFSDADNCREYLVGCRWPNGVTCPRCGSKGVKYQAKHNRWQCPGHHERRQFTLKTGTIFEDSPVGLDKWLAAMWQIVNCKNGTSSYEVHRAIGVTQKTAWSMDHRIRFALGMSPVDKLTGQVEADKTFTGGKVRNMHLSTRKRRITGKATKDKTAVTGIFERGGMVRTSVVPNRKKTALQAEVRKHIEAGAALHMNPLLSYEGLASEHAHQVADHTVEYVNGQVHTNGLENLWPLLKRRLSWTYIGIEPLHLFCYPDEQTVRYNHRDGYPNGDRFDTAVRQIVGKRLMFEQSTGKNQPEVFVN